MSEAQDMTAVRRMSQSMLRRWRPRIERRTTTRFWGRRRFVTPRIVPFIWGDGKQWIYLSPINQRPNYYVVRIDSRVDLSNYATANAFIDTCLDSVLEEIGIYFGERYEGDSRAHWPELDYTMGCEWGGYDPPRSSQ